MTLTDINLISFKDLKNITVQTTQKILDNNLTKFIHTSLQLNDINLKQNDKLFFTFIEESNIYEIYILNSNLTNIVLEDYIYHCYNFNSKYKYELFVFRSHYIIYKNTKYYFSKLNNNYEIKDILNFLEFKYKIKVSSIKIINSKTHEDYKNKYINSSKLNKINFLNLNATNSSSYYLLYLILMFVFIYFHSKYEFNQEVKVSKKVIKNEQVKDEDNINYIVYDLNKHKLLITSITFTNKKYTILLNSKNINNIHKFLNTYKNNLKILNVSLNNKVYYLKVEIEI